MAEQRDLGTCRVCQQPITETVDLTELPGTRIPRNHVTLDAPYFELMRRSQGPSARETVMVLVHAACADELEAYL